MGLFSKAPPEPEPRPSAASAIVETFASMPLEGWIAVSVIVLAIALSRDCVIVRLRRLVHGKSAPTRECAAVEEPAAAEEELPVNPVASVVCDHVSICTRRGREH